MFIENSIIVALIGLFVMLALVFLKGIYDGIMDEIEFHVEDSKGFEALEITLIIISGAVIIKHYGLKYIIQYLLGGGAGEKLGEAFVYDIGRGLGIAIRFSFKGPGYITKYLIRLKQKRALAKEYKKSQKTYSNVSSSSTQSCDNSTNKKLLYLLDGSNILHWEQDTRGISLDILCSICDFLKSHGEDSFVLFDASAPHVLRENNRPDLERFNSLIKNDSDHFRVIPAGTRADEYLLEEARREPKAVILTNDRYLDHYDKYCDVLDEGRECVQHGMIMRNGDICFLDIDLSIPVIRTPSNQQHNND